jgi:hypothetical protein
MNKTELDKIIASAIKSALAESEPKAKASGKASGKVKAEGPAKVVFEDADRPGILRAVKIFENGGRRSLCALSRDNWLLVREALKSL